MFGFWPSIVEFVILMDKGDDWDRTVAQLKSEGVEVVRNNARVSDYLDCRADKKTFCRLFGARLKYKTMKVGAFELKNEGSIPEDLSIKAVTLKRNVLMPPGFIDNHTIRLKNT